jgi:hypothetical protein
MRIVGMAEERTIDIDTLAASPRMEVVVDPT